MGAAQTSIGSDYDLLAKCCWLQLTTPQPSIQLLCTDCIPKDLLPHYQRLLASQPSRRLNPRAILEAGVLRNRLAEATSFLESLAIKDAMEKVREVEGLTHLCNHVTACKGLCSSLRLLGQTDHSASSQPPLNGSTLPLA